MARVGNVCEIAAMTTSAPALDVLKKMPALVHFTRSAGPEHSECCPLTEVSGLHATRSMQFKWIFILCLSFCVASCKKPEEDQQATTQPTQTAAATAGKGVAETDSTAEIVQARYDSIHDLVVRLIEAREFRGAEIALSVLAEMEPDLEPARVTQTHALRTWLSAARNAPATAPAAATVQP